LAHQRRWDEAAKEWQKVIDTGKADEDDYNGIAWEALFRGEHGAETVENAERAALFRRNPNWALLNTLATVYADAGRVVEARETLIKELDTGGRGQPESEEWLIIGRLAEQYGAKEEALAAYRRVTKPDEWLAGSSYELAQLWITRLAPEKPPPRTGAAARSQRVP
jgi:tetratricopeptide (TPR) repeat protein